MIDYQRLFHTGIRVPDLDAAMEEMGSTLGVTWAKSRRADGQPIWTPEDGQHTLPLRYVYSSEGPQHIELLEGPPGSVWDGREDPGVHHVGVWADDVQRETERCVANGWRVAAAGRSPEEGYGSYSYVVPPCGPIIELVDGGHLPAFETWWAGGD